MLSNNILGKISAPITLVIYLLHSSYRIYFQISHVLITKPVSVDKER